MKHLQFIAVALLVISMGCNSNTANKQNQESKNDTTTSLVFDKLLGTWENIDAKAFERWTKNGDSSYRSVVFTVKGTDTVFSEQAEICAEGNKWVFENMVTGQNAGKVVKFVSSYVEGNSVQFSNPQHDFPTDVNYTVKDANTVNAFIIGPNAKGGKDTIHYNYRRVK